MPKPNGLHHPPVGGTRERPFAGTSLKSHKLLENAYAAKQQSHHDGSGALCRRSDAPCVGRFLPFAIYSQTDSPQECQSNEKYHETKLFSCQRDHQGLHIRQEYPHPPSARLALNRSGKDDFKYSLAANSFVTDSPKHPLSIYYLSCSLNPTMMPSGPRM